MNRDNSKNSIKFDKNDLISIPNIVTLVRLIILPFILVALVKENHLLAFLLFVFAGLTDILDGFLARALDQITETGKILDPVVDKLFFLMIAVFLLFYTSFPLWAFIVIIALEFAILLGAYHTIINYHFIPVSNFYGKTAAFFISAAFYMYMLNLDFFDINIINDISLKYLTLILGVIFLLITVISYYLVVKKKIKKIVNGKNLSPKREDT
ncbi:MAG: CDP-alcohol phosphatidyltransferase family protein [Candidatus Cloacimonetes bacterium]|nr:CDP-alcohol phosphatidyltransferase family protein [Candidatus Cloacimonadota bacterium]MBS3767426.1 CDP-alcohol phosphatidyltransferase family protein [Candidatus Cloacimonadota bacterium]